MFTLPMAQYQHPYLNLGENMNSPLNDDFRFKIFVLLNLKLKKQQECIPVGCVPSAAVAVSQGGVPGPGGVYLVWRSTWSQGGLPGPRGCTWSGECTWSGGGVCSGGCTWPRGVPCSRRGVCSGGVSVPQGGVPGQVLPPLDRQTPVKT